MQFERSFTAAHSSDTLLLTEADIYVEEPLAKEFGSEFIAKAFEFCSYEVPESVGVRRLIGCYVTVLFFGWWLFHAGNPIPSYDRMVVKVICFAFAAAIAFVFGLLAPFTVPARIVNSSTGILSIFFLALSLAHQF